MIVLLDTSTPVCRLRIIDQDNASDYEWQADRELAKGLLGFLRDSLKIHNATWQDVQGIGVYRGPGSFTGLRIGLTVANTLARSLAIPIVGTTGETWQTTAHNRLKNGENDTIVMPEYGSPARITTPRK